MVWVFLGDRLHISLLISTTFTMNFSTLPEIIRKPENPVSLMTKENLVKYQNISKYCDNLCSNNTFIHSFPILFLDFYCFLLCIQVVFFLKVVGFSLEALPRDAFGNSLNLSEPVYYRTLPHKSFQINAVDTRSNLNVYM